MWRKKKKPFLTPSFFNVCCVIKGQWCLALGQPSATIGHGLEKKNYHMEAERQDGRAWVLDNITELSHLLSDWPSFRRLRKIVTSLVFRFALTVKFLITCCQTHLKNKRGKERGKESQRNACQPLQKWAVRSPAAAKTESPRSGPEDFLWGQGAPNTPSDGEMTFVHCLLATNPFSNPGASYPNDWQMVLLTAPAPKPWENHVIANITVIMRKIHFSLTFLP